MGAEAIFDVIQGVLNDFVTANQNLFVPTGQRLFLGLATIIFSWAGLQTAFGGQGPDMGRFARLLMFIAFWYAAVNYYSSPIPGIGYSFVSLVTEQVNWMVNTMAAASLQEINNGVRGLYQGMAMPHVWNLLEVFHYWTLTLLMMAVAAASYLVISFGYIVQAVCVVIGPVFLPFMLVPQLSWLATGFLRSFLMFSFYPVVAAAFVLVFGKLLVLMLQTQFGVLTGTIPVHVWMGKAPMLYILFFVFLFGIFKVPTVTAQIFSGAAGATSGMASSVTRVVSAGFLG
jgi:hypothetical protein